MNCMNKIMNVLQSELTPTINWAIDEMHDNEWIQETLLAKAAVPLLLSRLAVSVVALNIATACAATSPLLAIASAIVGVYAAVEFGKFAVKAIDTYTRCGAGFSGSTDFLRTNMDTLWIRMRQSPFLRFVFG